MGRVLLVAAAAFLASAALVSAAGGQIFGPVETEADRKIFRLVNRAVRHAERDPGCRQRDPTRATFTDEPPSARLLATLGILRREQASNERLPDEDLSDTSIEGLYRGHVRIARSADGRAFLLVPGRDIDLHEAFPARCAARARRRFDRLLRGEHARFKRRARRVLRSVLRLDLARPERTVEGLYLFERHADGRPASGGSVSVTELRRNGYISAVSSRSAAPSRVEGLVPDGVATVTAHYPRVARRIGNGEPRRYASRVTRSSLVRDNVFSFVVPRRFEDSYPPKFVWRAPDGRVVKVLR